MAKKVKSDSAGFFAQMMKIKAAGLGNRAAVRQRSPDELELLPLEKRVELVLGLFDQAVKKAGNMIYFVMYDIEHNKIRTYMAKYLLKKGCIRVQKSIFLASSERVVFDEIFKTLRDVQAVYDNHDSIFMVPVSQEQLLSMKVIGQNLQFDIVSSNKNTLFF
jgi:CRISPR-associated endonuclease Cas2